MAVETDAEFLNFNVSPSKTSLLNVRVPNLHYNAEHNSRKTTFYSGRILKPRRSSSLNLFSKSLIAHLQQPKFLNEQRFSDLLDFKTMKNSNIGDSVTNAYVARGLRDYTNHGFNHAMLMEEHVSSNEIDSLETSTSRFSSPIEDVPSRSSKSPNSIEDLNKEIERLFLNNDKFGFSSFLWDQDGIAEGRRAPIADMLHCYKSLRPNHRKKRRSTTSLGIQLYNESDSSNDVSSPDDTSGCEEYVENALIEDLDRPIIAPVPGKSEIDHVQMVNINPPYSDSKFQLSEDSAFAPIKSAQRSQSTPP